jgi:hypothetical protein
VADVENWARVGVMIASSSWFQFRSRYVKFVACHNTKLEFVKNAKQHDQRFMR